uniref:Uncharacterized protein n=1 Tax=Anguilla anguilla TaxID=7936 RepID=A0A0E9TX50_ANGAN
MMFHFDSARVDLTLVISRCD